MQQTGTLPEQGVHKRAAVEYPQILNMLPHPYVFDGNPEIIGNTDHNTSLCGTVQFW